MDPTSTPDGTADPPGAASSSRANGGVPDQAPALRAHGRPRPVAGVSRRTVTIGAAGLAAAGGLTGWFAATATKDGSSVTTVDNQVSTVDPFADIPTDGGPVFGDQGGQLPSDQGSFPSGGADTSSGAS